MKYSMTFFVQNFPRIGMLMLLFAFSVCPQDADAQGNLLINPRRVVFEGNKKTQELNLANTGKDTARYVISFIEIRMSESGGFERITQPDSGQKFASHYLRIFPRSVTLGPGEAQAVKLQLRNTAQLETGEYRSHIYFRAAKDDVIDDEHTPNDKSISVQLKPVFGISIPVIIRVGESDTRTSITDISVSTDSVLLVKMAINREGNMSTYGDLTINHISNDGKLTQVGYVRGLAVYTPTKRREVILELDKTKPVNYRSGKIQVVYTAEENEKDILAETTLKL